jgi:hypothetical protein
MNTREKNVIILAKHKALYVVGGHENDLDDLGIEMPSQEALINEVYNEIINNPVIQVGNAEFSVKKDLRFVGKERLMQIAKIAVELAK